MEHTSRGTDDLTTIGKEANVVLPFFAVSIHGRMGCVTLSQITVGRQLGELDAADALADIDATTRQTRHGLEYPLVAL